MLRIRCQPARLRTRRCDDRRRMSRRRRGRVRGAGDVHARPRRGLRPGRAANGSTGCSGIVPLGHRVPEHRRRRCPARSAGRSPATAPSRARRARRGGRCAGPPDLIEASSQASAPAEQQVDGVSRRRRRRAGVREADHDLPLDAARRQAAKSSVLSANWWYERAACHSRRGGDPLRPDVGEAVLGEQGPRRGDQGAPCRRPVGLSAVGGRPIARSASAALVGSSLIAVDFHTDCT